MFDMRSLDDFWTRRLVYVPSDATPLTCTPVIIPVVRIHSAISFTKPLGNVPTSHLGALSTGAIDVHEALWRPCIVYAPPGIDNNEGAQLHQYGMACHGLRHTV